MAHWNHEAPATPPAISVASTGMVCEYPFHQRNQADVYASPLSGVSARPQNTSAPMGMDGVGGGFTEASHCISIGMPLDRLRQQAQSEAQFSFLPRHGGFPDCPTRYMDPYAHHGCPMYQSSVPASVPLTYQHLCGGRPAPPPVPGVPRSASSPLWRAAVMIPAQHWGPVGYFPAAVGHPSAPNFRGPPEPPTWSGADEVQRAGGRRTIPEHPEAFTVHIRRRSNYQEPRRLPVYGHHQQPFAQTQTQRRYSSSRPRNAPLHGSAEFTPEHHRSAADERKYRLARANGQRVSATSQPRTGHPLVRGPTHRRGTMQARARMIGGSGELDAFDLYTFEAAESLDVDNMSYEELLELTERLGMVERGVQPSRLDELRVVITAAHMKRGSESDRLVAGRNEFAASDPDVEGVGEVANSETCEEDKLMCCVCLDDVLIGQLATHLPCCRHFLHERCAAPWFESHFRCPICKSDVRGGDQ